jgi:hypothetical protein
MKILTVWLYFYALWVLFVLVSALLVFTDVDKDSFRWYLLFAVDTTIAILIIYFGDKGKNFRNKKII